MNFLAIHSSAWIAIIIATIAAFILGTLYKVALVAKQRRRILQLEDEMLSNHKQILDLEKKISETTTERATGQQTLKPIITDREVKAS